MHRMLHSLPMLQYCRMLRWLLMHPSFQWFLWLQFLRSHQWLPTIRSFRSFQTHRWLPSNQKHRWLHSIQNHRCCQMRPMLRTNHLILMRPMYRLRQTHLLIHWLHSNH